MKTALIFTTLALAACTAAGVGGGDGEDSVAQAVGITNCDLTFTPADASVIPARVASAKVGAVFCFDSGTYDMRATVEPRSGDTYVWSGRGGTTLPVLRGAKPIVSWTASGGLFFATDSDVQPLRSTDAICLSADDKCSYDDWLFAGPVTLDRVFSKASVTAGTFFIDYAAHRIWVSESGSYEYSFVRAAFDGGATRDVTLKSLKVVKYATAFNGAAIRFGDGGGWLVDGVWATRNHTSGIVMRGGTSSTGRIATTRNSTLIENQRKGIYLNACDDCVVQNNEVYGTNSIAGFESGYVGGIRAMWSRGVKILDNFVHDNRTNGIWLDGDEADTLVSGNQSLFNAAWSGGGEGIRVEVSCRNTVQNNEVAGNETAQIDIINSHHNTVTGNTVRVAGAGFAGDFGIKVVANDRDESAARFPNCKSGAAPAFGDTGHDASSNVVKNNSIDISGSAASDGVVRVGSVGNVSNNAFLANTYSTGGACGAKRWKWFAGGSANTVDFATWKGSFRQDTAGSCN